MIESGETQAAIEANPYLPVDIQVPIEEEIIAIFGGLMNLENIGHPVTFRIQETSKSAKKALGNLLPERQIEATKATIQRNSIAANLKNQMQTIQIALEANIENYSNPNLNYPHIDEDSAVWAVSFHLRGNGDLSKMYFNSEHPSLVFEVILSKDGELIPVVTPQKDESIKPWHDTAIEGHTKIDAPNYNVN